MPAHTPNQLVDEFKKSGEFDRLRRELLTSFRNGQGITTLVGRVDEITKNKLSSENKLQYMAEASAVRELMQELERYPLVERAVADVPALTDPSFSASLRQHLGGILHGERQGLESIRVLGATTNSTDGAEPATQSTPALSKVPNDVIAPAEQDKFVPTPLLTTRTEVTGQSKAAPPRIVTDTTVGSVPNSDPGEPSSPGSAMVESPLSDHAAESKVNSDPGATPLSN